MDKLFTRQRDQDCHVLSIQNCHDYLPDVVVIRNPDLDAVAFQYLPDLLDCRV